MKKKVLSIILLLIFSVPILSGCYDYKEPNDIAYIVAIAIDEAQNDGVYNYSLQFARPSQISGGSSEEGGSGKETIGMVSVEAPSVYSALSVANHVISKNFTLAHTKIIVISDSLAKKGVYTLLDSIGRSSDIRPGVFICVSNGEAKKYLESVNPVIEINPVKYYRLIFENPNSSYFPKSTAKQLYSNMKANIAQSIVPLVGVAAKSQDNSQNESQQGSASGGGGSGGGSSGGGGGGGSSSGGGGSGAQQSSQGEQSEKELNKINKEIPINQGGFEYHMKQYVAGKLDVEKQNESEVIGAGVFKEDKKIAELSNLECEIYNIITGNFQNSYSVIYSKNSPKEPITIRIEQTRKPKILVDLKSGNPKIKIEITLEGNFMSVASDYPAENEIESFEEETSQYIKEAAMKFLNKTTKEFDSDIFGFGNYAKRSFLTYNDFENYNWNEKFKNSEFEFLVDFQIRKTGLIIRNE